MSRTGAPPVRARLRALRSPVVRTPRLDLVLPDRAYDAQVVRLLNDRSVTRWTLHIPFPYRRADARAYHRRWPAGRRAGTNLSLQIVRRADGRLLGGIGLHKINAEHRSAEVGYWIGRPYRRQGYAREALAAVVRLVFRRLGLERLEARVFPGNEASCQLLLVTGFAYEGRMRRSIRKAGRARDELVYARLAADPPPPAASPPGARPRGAARPSGTPTR